jgi:hypothetical protein
MTDYLDIIHSFRLETEKVSVKKSVLIYKWKGEREYLIYKWKGEREYLILRTRQQDLGFFTLFWSKDNLFLRGLTK